MIAMQTTMDAVQGNQVLALLTPSTSAGATSGSLWPPLPLLGSGTVRLNETPGGLDYSDWVGEAFQINSSSLSAMDALRESADDLQDHYVRPSG